MPTHLMTATEQEAIFRRWLEAHIGLMLKVVRGCVSAPQDQDDLLQDVLLQIWSSIPAFRGEAKETTWIYRVAFNTALAWRREDTSIFPFQPDNLKTFRLDRAATDPQGGLPPLDTLH